MPGLGRSIGKAADCCRHPARKCIQRGHGDNASGPLALHVGGAVLDVVEAALEVDRDGAVEFLFRDFKDALRCGTPRIIEQEIQPPPLCDDLGDDFARTGMVCHIGLKGQDPYAHGAQLFTRFLKLRAKDVHERDIKARAHQIHCTGLADASRCTGDECCLCVVQHSEIRSFSFRSVHGIGRTSFYNRNIVHVCEPKC